MVLMPGVSTRLKNLSRRLGESFRLDNFIQARLRVVLESHSSLLLLGRSVYPGFRVGTASWEGLGSTRENGKLAAPKSPFPYY